MYAVPKGNVSVFGKLVTCEVMLSPSISSHEFRLQRAKLRWAATAKCDPKQEFLVQELLWCRNHW